MWRWAQPARARFSRSTNRRRAPGRTDANIKRDVEYELKCDPDIQALLGLALLPQTARVTRQRDHVVLDRDPDI